MVCPSCHSDLSLDLSTRGRTDSFAGGTRFECRNCGAEVDPMAMLSRIEAPGVGKQQRARRLVWVAAVMFGGLVLLIVVFLIVSTFLLPN
jgi:hypothetical protein